MNDMEEIILSLLLVALVVAVYHAGYSFGRADGIKWTRDVYNGKYDNEIFKTSKLPPEQKDNSNE